MCDRMGRTVYTAASKLGASSRGGSVATIEATCQPLHPTPPNTSPHLPIRLLLPIPSTSSTSQLH